MGELRKAGTKLQRARRARNTGAEEAALARLGELITSHHEDRKVWRQICRMMDHKRRLIESERKHLVQARQMIPVEEVVVLVAALTNSVARRVDDPAVRAAIVPVRPRLARQRTTTVLPSRNSSTSVVH